MTLIGIGADDGESDGEVTASLDLYLGLDRGPGSLHFYIEGSTTPRSNGVSLLFPESNGDAGTALNRDGEGRLQLSELKYAFKLPGTRTLDAGMLDVTAYLDTTRINNDENMQFLGAGFLNNPTIGFPDYTLGVVYSQEPRGRGPAWSAALAGSHGLADNPDASYDELFDVTEDGKGVFLGAEAGWQTPKHRYRLGAWYDTSDHPLLSGDPGSDDNRGVYASLGASRGRHAGNVRLGLAEERVSPAQAFASLTYQHGRERMVVGLGAARSWSSGELAGVAPHSTQLEAYLRLEAARGLFVTPSVQHLRNSAFDPSPAGGRQDVLVYAVRLRYQL